MNFKIVFLLILLSGACFAVHAQSQPQIGPMQQHINHNLKQIENCWNEGRLACLMEYYVHAPTTLYTDKEGVIQGWDNINSHYKKSYGSLKKHGHLTLTPVVYKPLGKHFALLIAQFKLATKTEVRVGYTSLIWRQSEHEWKIMSDHSA